VTDCAGNAAAEPFLTMLAVTTSQRIGDLIEAHRALFYEASYRHVEHPERRGHGNSLKLLIKRINIKEIRCISSFR
jgi:hypothetical protein